MSVFTRHRTGASDASTTGSRHPSATDVASRMHHQRSTMPVMIAGTRLTIPS
jgi:hypothetical protein